MRTSLLALAVLLLAGCLGPNPNITYDIEGETSALGVALELIFVGRSEGDRSSISGPHAAGALLAVSVRYKDVFSSLRNGTIESSDEAVVAVLAQDADGPDIDAVLSMAGPGDTTLLVRDRNGIVVDRQAVSVREPVSTLLSSADDLEVGAERPVALTDTVHLAQGGSVTFAYVQMDADGAVLTGSGLLSTAWVDPPTGVDLDRESVESGSIFDVFDLEADDDAPLASGRLVHLGTADVAAEGAVQVHDVEEITALELEQHPLGGADGGTGHVLAVAWVGDLRLHGVPATWVDGAGSGLGTGTILSWEAGEPEEVRACLPNGTCGWTTLPGRAGDVSSGSVSSCSAAGGSAGLFALLLLPAIARRRAVRPPG